MTEKKVVISSLMYKYFERTLYQGALFIIQIILARILDPESYGTVALMTIFINISQVFVQSGLNTALVQFKEINDVDYDSVFWCSTLISVLLYIVLFAAAPLLADYYSNNELCDVFRVLALILIPGAYNSIQNAKMIREMQFKKIMFCSFIAVIISGTIGIIVATLQKGVWALVAQQLSNQIAICVLMFLYSRWFPKKRICLIRLKKLFRFGWKLLCSSLLETIYNELSGLVIGKKYSADTLGYFNRGKQFPQLVVSNINGSIQSVMLPVLSKEQDDIQRLKAIMRRSIAISSYLIFPMLVGLGVVAESLVKILLTEKWLPCVPYLHIFCFVYAFYPIHTANLQALNAQGRSDWYLRLEIVKKIIGVITLVITIIYFDTPLAIAIGGMITTVFSCFANSYPNIRLLNYSIKEQMEDIIPLLLMSIIMGAAICLIPLLNLSIWLTLIIQVLFGVFIYIFLSKIMKIESYYYFKDVILSIINKK